MAFERNPKLDIKKCVLPSHLRPQTNETKYLHKKFNKTGRSFALPSFQHDNIFLPGTRMKWIAEQPDTVMSAAEMQRDSLQTHRTLLDLAIVRNPLHQTVIKRDLKHAAETNSSVAQYDDFLSWLLKEGEASLDPTETSAMKLVLRLMAVNFAAIHTSTFIATNVLFDLYYSPDVDELVRENPQRSDRATSSERGRWDKRLLAKLVKTDSALNESLRVSTLVSKGMERLVIDPKGVRMENGLFLPRGTKVTAATYAIHYDESIYENAATYDAFRFLRARDLMGSKKGGEVVAAGSEEDVAARKLGLGKVLESRNLSTVTALENFLSFGHGRHACPGRFFAVAEMKLLIALVVLHSDVVPLKVRPPNSAVGPSIVPPMKAPLSVRRRKV